MNGMVFAYAQNEYSECQGEPLDNQELSRHERRNIKTLRRCH